MRSWIGVSLGLGFAGAVVFAVYQSYQRPVVAELAAGGYRPDRSGYVAFRSTRPEVLEPNYLPFMLHRLPEPNDRGEALVFCRWPDEQMPLTVYIEAPRIPSSLQDEFRPMPPKAYVQAVSRALDAWERELEGLVRFRRVDKPREAVLRLRILGKRAPEPTEEIRVLGSTDALITACAPKDWDGPADPVSVSFEVPELVIYVADRAGPLTAHQVEGVALHEIGHALGMRGHSPIPTDFMYRIVRDRPSVDRLSIEDLNSFLSLYRLPNGTRYGRFDPSADPVIRSPVPPGPEPELALAPHVDARFGFQINTPADWIRVETEQGFFAANGPLWDRDASIEVVVSPYPTLEAFLERFSGALFADTWLRHRASLVVNGRRALRIRVEDDRGEREQTFTLVELGDGRVMMILTECPVAVARAWAGWFEATLGSLEILTDRGWTPAD